VKEGRRKGWEGEGSDLKIERMKERGKREEYTLQHNATHCNTLQHTATLCNTLQHSATPCNTLQHPATHT